MAKAPGHKVWETRPIECWEKAKKIRRDFEEGRVKAAGAGRLLVDGRDSQIFDGFGNLQSTMTNPLGAMIQASNSEFARECRAATECNGFGREICGYHRNVFGSMYLDRDMLGGSFPRRDISIPVPSTCDQHSKRGQPVADHFGIPRFQGEACNYTGPEDPERSAIMVEHRVQELLEQIEFLEKTTGRKFNDQVLHDSVLHNMMITKYAGEVCAANQAIPAPVDQKSLYSFYTLGGLTRGDLKETEDLWRALRDEVLWRVQNKIAAVATERYRWLEDEPPPWHFLRFYRYMEKYGAVCIGSPYTHGIGGPMEWKPDGTYGPKPTPVDLGMPLNTREEIIRANAIVYSSQGRDFREINTPDKSVKFERLFDMAKAYKVQGAIRPQWNGGVGCDYGSREIKLALEDLGLSVMYYEGCQPGDRTDVDDNRLLDQLDHWMEGQGLKRLED